MVDKNMQIAGSVVEALALKLVLLGRLDPTALLPLLQQLAAAASGHGLDAEVARLAQLLATCEEQPQEKYAAFAAVLETLRQRTSEVAVADSRPGSRREAAAGATGVVTEIRYDKSNSADIMNHFFLESSAHLQTVEQAALHLETAGADQGALTDAFGALHSLKGVTGFLDLGVLRDLVHDAEAVIELARRRSTGASRPDCDLLLRTVDQARVILDRIRTHAQQPEQPFPALPEGYAPLREELRGAAVAGSSVNPPPAQVEKPGTQLPGDNRRATQVTAAPAENRAPAEGALASAMAVLPATGDTQVLHHNRRETDVPTVAAALVRVHVEKLDRLIDAIGELAITQIQIFQNPLLQDVQDETLNRNIALAGKITRELQTLAMTLRMVPLKETFGRMTRLARDLAHRQDKDLAVEITGDDTEMDKSLIELLLDPLTHLVRNAVDHGVASPAERIRAGKPARATVRLSAWSQGGHVIVEVSDDGGGLQMERILAKARQRGVVRENETPDSFRLQQFIFEPGFSTAEQITDVSGRGIGLDVVRSKALSVGGRVVVRSQPGAGTTFTITLPLTLAIIDGLLVQSGREQFILPMTLVLESLRPSREMLGTVHERGETIEYRGQAFPLIRLSDYANIRGAKRDPTETIVILVDSRGEQFALQVDEILGVQQVVIKGLGDRLQGMKGVSGGAILGDGRVRLILDVAGILAASRETSFSHAG